MVDKLIERIKYMFSEKWTFNKVMLELIRGLSMIARREINPRKNFRIYVWGHCHLRLDTGYAIRFVEVMFVPHYDTYASSKLNYILSHLICSDACVL